MDRIDLRPMARADWREVADLICLSTNYWYQSHGMRAIFANGPESTLLFCEVYEALDPGCCILAVAEPENRIVGSCFYHPRETHYSLGIMNVHPNYFGHSIAVRLLDFIIDAATRDHKPVRLVSSAMNLDSFSLYTRSGFVPRMTFQDMFINVPESGMGVELAQSASVRPATIADVSAIADAEQQLNHLRREKDWQHFIENQAGIWHVSVFEKPDGGIAGALGSVQHPGSNMIGPGFAESEEQAAAMLLAELNHNRGRSPVFLVPVQCANLVKQAYAWGARNCEMHVAQVYGNFRQPDGVFMPTFMPETA